MRSRFAVQGHPIHPLLITLPIGLFVWTLVSDLVFLGTEIGFWFEIARWTGLAAIGTALLAAVPGFGDYLTVPFTTRARIAATAHMLLNLTVIGAYVAAAVFMFGDFLGIGMEGTSTTALWIALGLHAFGVVLLVFSGWLGGEMVYKHHIGMVPEAIEARERRGRGSRGFDRERAA